MKTELAIIQTQIWILISILTTNRLLLAACTVGIVLGMIELGLQLFKGKN